MTEHCYAKYHLWSVSCSFALSVAILNVVMLSVVVSPIRKF